MKLSIKFLGVLILVLGISLLIKPEIIFGLIETNVDSTSLYITAIVVRIVFGVLFIVASDESKHPRLLKFMGYLFIFAAFVFILMGKADFQDFIGELLQKTKHLARIAGLLGAVFGTFLLHTYSKK
jgi:hypothetical protein